MTGGAWPALPSTVPSLTGALGFCPLAHLGAGLVRELLARLSGLHPQALGQTTLVAWVGAEQRGPHAEPARRGGAVPGPCAVYGLGVCGPGEAVGAPGSSV